MTEQEEVNHQVFLSKATMQLFAAQDRYEEAAEKQVWLLERQIRVREAYVSLRAIQGGLTCR